MIPSKTYDVVGGSTVGACITRPAHDYYALTGSDLNDLAVLAVRMNSKFHDANELRDWQNRLSLMLSKAELVT